MKDQNDGLFFVEVKEPDEIRRDILETLKSILEALQNFEKFKHTRHEKLERINKLRLLLKDTNKMFGNLKSMLPQANLKVSIAKEPQKQPEKEAREKKVKRAAEPKAQKKEMSDLERLESELNAIEGKLRSLT